MTHYLSRAPDPCTHAHRAVREARQCARRRGGGTVAAIEDGTEREITEAEAGTVGRPALGEAARSHRVAAYLDAAELARLDAGREPGESRGACLVRRAGVR